MLRHPLHVIRANYTLDTSHRDSCCRDVLLLFLLQDFSVHYAIGKIIL